MFQSTLFQFGFCTRLPSGGNLQNKCINFIEEVVRIYGRLPVCFSWFNRT